MGAVEKGIRCFFLWLKVYFKRKTTWLQLAGMVLLIWLIGSISFPDPDNVRVGVCCTGGDYANELAKRLYERDDVYRFDSYETPDKLEKAVLAGEVECGFAFDEQLDEQMEDGDLDEAIVFVATPLCVKGEVIKETVYAELLKLYSDEILKRNEQDIFGEENKERTKKLLEYNRYYQEGDAVFKLEIKEVDTHALPAEQVLEEPATYPVEGMVGLFTFLIVFLAYGRKFEDRGWAVEKALSKRERLVYGCLSHTAAGILPALVGIVLIALYGGAGNGIVAGAGLLLLVIISGMWVTIVGSFFKKHTTFVATILTVVVANLLICPVFLNFETYVPALKVVKLIFPLGIYLMIL